MSSFMRISNVKYSKVLTYRVAQKLSHNQIVKKVIKSYSSVPIRFICHITESINIIILSVGIKYS